jgi:hypothetical protein
MIATLREMQHLYLNVHAPNASNLRDQVDVQVKNIIADGGAWAVNEMRHLEETWADNYNKLTQVVEHFHLTEREIQVVIDALELTMESL